MSITKESNKAWLSPEGVPSWVETHIDGASKILNRHFKHSSTEAYDVMFGLGHLRLQFDGYDLFFNGGGKTPNADQLKWLQTIALQKHYVLINGDTSKEVDLESRIYKENDGDDLGEKYDKNKGNSDFQAIVNPSS